MHCDNDATLGHCMSVKTTFAANLSVTFVKTLHSLFLFDKYFAVHILQWRKPFLITGLSQVVVPGCNSKEKDTQRDRELGVLQVLYFSKNM